MAHSVTHTFVSPVADDSDPNEVGPDEWNAAHTVTLDADELLTSIKTVDGTGSGLDADTVDGNEAAALLARANHTGTQAASTISDFDTEVSNNTDVAANTAARHDAVTVTDSSEINFTLTGQDITAALVAGSIDETKLDTSVNASLDLADSALQSSDIGTSVQAWDAQLDSLSSASANGVSLVTAADYAAMKGLLDLEIGTDVQAYSADLTDLVARWAPASASGPASLDFLEDTDNGSNKVTVTAPASLSGDVTATLPSTTGTLALTSEKVSVIRVQTFTASGTYTPHANMLYCVAESLGAGGGGGGVQGAAGVGGGAGGGGGGGYSRAVLSAATVGSSQTVTIGAAGAGGSAGNNNGSAGGDTSLGALCIGKGGAGGGGTNGGSNIGGAGGVAGTGDLAGVGARGGFGVGGVNSIGYGGTGANSILGGGGYGNVANGAAGAGAAGSGYGAGGGGASFGNNTGTAAGGDGTAGICIVTEYCSA